MSRLTLAVVVVNSPLAVSCGPRASPHVPKLGPAAMTAPPAKPTTSAAAMTPITANGVRDSTMARPTTMRTTGQKFHRSAMIGMSIQPWAAASATTPAVTSARPQKRRPRLMCILNVPQKDP